MDLRLLEDFLTLSQLKSFSRAAERRNSTQSAFSRRIQALEAWAGTRLIDRRSNPIQITRAGQALIGIAEDVLRTLQHGREEILTIADDTMASVSFSVTHSLSLTFFPKWIREIEKDIGLLSIRLLSNDGEICRSAVIRGDCHFMMSHFEPRMSEDFKSSRLRSISVGHDRLIPIAAPDDQGSPMTPIPGGPDKRTRYLTYSRGSSLGRSVDLLLSRPPQPVYLEPCFEASLAEGLKAMVIQGHGVAWLPEVMVRQELDQGILVRAGDSCWDINLEIRIFRAATRLPKRAEQLWSALAAQLREVTSFF